MNQSKKAPFNPRDPVVHARLKNVRSRRALRACLGIVLGLVGCYALILALFLGLIPEWFGIAAFWFGTPIVVILSLWHCTHSENNLVRSVVKVNSIEALGPLLSATEFTRGLLRTDVRQALMALMPLARQYGVLELTPQQRIRLCRMLYIGDVDLSIAILGVLELHGDAACLPYLHAVAGGRSLPEPARTRAGELITAAQKCINSVNARVEAANTAGSLLRPSEHGDADADTLLRSAHGAGIENPKELLRPDDTSGASQEAGPY